MDNLQVYFDATMSRFIQERQIPPTYPNGGGAKGRQGAPRTASQPESRRHTMLDVEMESVESCEFDPDDLDLEGRLGRWSTPR